MPNGFNSRFFENLPETFESYMWRCSRAMGALIMMRDFSLTADITTSRIIAESDYYPEQLLIAQAKLERLEKMTKDEIAEECKSYYDSQMLDYNSQSEKNKKTEEKISAVLKRVTVWEPPTKDHEGLKALAVGYLNEALKETTYNHKPELITPAQWLNDQMAYCKRTIENAKNNIATHTDRNQERLNWVKELIESIGAPPNMNEQ